MWFKLAKESLNTKICCINNVEPVNNRDDIWIQSLLQG